jgi:hypothetical protein
MNREDVVRWAREANIHVIENNTFADDMYISVLYRFATIVAAAGHETCEFAALKKEVEELRAENSKMREILMASYAPRAWEEE